ncbi:hypothetical protein FG167_12525 [Lacinutrix sp. WUR7]|uniref:hypothetical protein n=1 Tax=Lacinutrix sp. WUR7 TaxID=2653681 RepID=UPI00193D8817|nr:hypothetical protein [Lacinutrix sp. WUR7]QRM90019.1 hypothetical protein FG167_12525 [Lacinutrix sp. WUR7]
MKQFTILFVFLVCTATSFSQIRHIEPPKKVIKSPATESRPDYSIDEAKLEIGKCPLFSDESNLRFIKVFKHKTNAFNPKFAKVYLYKYEPWKIGNGAISGVNSLNSFYVYSYKIQFDNDLIKLILIGEEDYDIVQATLNREYSLRLENQIHIDIKSLEQLKLIESILNKEKQADLLFNKNYKLIEYFPDELPIIWD